MVKKSYVISNYVKCISDLELFAVVDDSIPLEYVQYFTHAIFELNKRGNFNYSISQSCDLLDLYQQKEKVISAIYDSLASSNGDIVVTTKVFGITPLLVNIILAAYPVSSTTTIKGNITAAIQFSLQNTIMVKGSFISPGFELLTMECMETFYQVFSKSISFAPVSDVTNSSHTDIRNRNCAFTVEPNDGVKTAFVIKYDYGKLMLSIRYRVRHALMQFDDEGFLLPYEIAAQNNNILVGAYSKIDGVVYLTLSVREVSVMKAALCKSKPEPVPAGEQKIKRSKLTNNETQIIVTVISAFKHLS